MRTGNIRKWQFSIILYATLFTFFSLAFNSQAVDFAFPFRRVADWNIIVIIVGQVQNQT